MTVVVRSGRKLASVAAAAAIMATVAMSGCLKSQTPAKADCTGDADCGAGFQCLDRKCAARTCARTADCPEGFACEEGVCVQLRRNCVTNRDCPSPQVCADIRCVELAPTDCELAQTSVDFGVVAAGVPSAPQTLVIRNHSDSPFYVSIGDISSGEGSAFAFSADFTSGDHLVPAMARDTTPGSLIVPLVFKPAAVGEYTDTLPILRPCSGEVTLHGVAVDHTLECSGASRLNGPPPAGCRTQFGYVNPGAKLIQQVAFRNLGTKPVRMELGLLTQPPGAGEPFAVEESTRSFSIPPGQGTVSVSLSFAPTELGLQSATLAYSSDDPGRPSGTIELAGIGGGPAIDVQPGQLDFGQVAVTTFQYRRITVANVGMDFGGTTEDNLIFAEFVNGQWLEKRAEIAGPDASEFFVEWPPQDYAGYGLAEGQSADLRVRFAPLVRGPKQALLRIYSNDPVTPTLEIPLAGIGADLPPCAYDVSPPALAFGAVEANRNLTLTFTIINRATSPGDACLVSMLDLDRSTREHGVFWLANGPQGIDAVVAIPGGGKLDVPVRFAPRQDGQYSGEVDFYISSPTRPEVHVTLSGVAAPSCLLIAPRELDYGTIGVNCNSRQRLFTMYNTCASTLVVIAIDKLQGPSNEFSVTKRPALPVTIAGGAQSDFGVTYHPVDVGDDTGAVAVTLQGNANPLIVQLQGRGATDPIQTDVISQSNQPKVDVMLIIDDSCSMATHQATLASNFSNFISSAILNHVDYHIAATTVSVDDPSYECGRFVPLTGSNPRVITPSTPNKEMVFSQKVALGTNGSGIEALIRPGYLALTNPLINGHNAGFYRDEAKLAIVVLSDAADADPVGAPVSFYENFFVGLKGAKRRNDLSFSGFIPLMATDPDASSGCSYDGPGAGQDTRVKQLIGRTGGLAEEICNSNWAAAVEAIGARAFGLKTTYFLLNIPDMTVTPDPIVVTVDGAAYPQVSASGQHQWTYDSVVNAIQFDPLATPGLTSAITVSYHVACL